MTAASYVPGGWLGLVRSGTAVVLGPDTPAPLVNTVWDLLGDGPEVHDVLHAVTSGFGVPLSRTPWFGIIGIGESLRVFLRGDLDLTVQLPGGPVELDGRNVTTWTERWLDAPEWFSLTVPGQSSALELPVTEGAVFLKTLRVEVTGGGKPTVNPREAASAQEANPEAVLEQAPEASAETVAGIPEETSAGMPGNGPADGGIEETRMPETGFTVTGAADLSGSIEEEPQPQPQPQPRQPAPATELTGSYDHLWDKTVVRRIEDAAVRDDQDDDGAPRPASEATDGTESAGQESAGQEPAEPREANQKLAAAPDAEPVAEPAPASHAPASGGLIDSVPWATGGDRARAPRPRRRSFPCLTPVRKRRGRPNRSCRHSRPPRSHPDRIYPDRSCLDSLPTATTTGRPFSRATWRRRPSSPPRPLPPAGRRAEARWFWPVCAHGATPARPRARSAPPAVPPSRTSPCRCRVPGSAGCGCPRET
ncbi:hypothetical protein [Arthrobacter sp. KBS0703]|uniref:hypothetical protein n=1 Tax=Arthrobacter sp. KBS0703 TaxID=1955698 RepID=UPI0021B0ADC7|nr:hypothetical protein [Arthrobacter sp. KBS0703]